MTTTTTKELFRYRLTRPDPNIRFPAKYISESEEEESEMEYIIPPGQKAKKSEYELNLVRREDYLREQEQVEDDGIPEAEYIIADVKKLNEIEGTTLRQTATELKFPLSDEDKRDIDILMKKFHSDQDILSISAPQIGISKRIIMVDVPESLGKEEEDFPICVLINPQWKKFGNDMVEEMEECVSVHDRIGPVRRYKTIHYKAFDYLRGKITQGLVSGDAAAAIQHEVDHLDGRLFIEHVPKYELMTLAHYVRKVKVGTLKKKGLLNTSLHAPWIASCI